MDEASQELFNRLVKMNPEDLTSDERGFLNARRGYLNNEQKRVFQSVLTEVVVPTGETSKKPGRPKKV